MSESVHFIARLDTSLRNMQGRPQTWLILAGIALLFSIAIGSTLTIEQFRQNAIEAGGDALRNSSLVLARHFDREFEDFAILQRATQSILQSTDIESPAAFSTEMATRDVHEMLRRRTSEWSDVAGANVFNAEGVLINSSRTWPVPNVRIADRGYFQRLKNNAELQDEMETVVGRFGDAPVLVFVRKVVSPNGEFLGVVTRGMQESRIRTFLESAALNQDASIALYHRNGQLLAQFPNIGAQTFDSVAPGSIQDNAIANAPTTLVRDNVSGDEPSIVLASSPLLTRPAIVVMTRTLNATLASWRSQTNFFIMMAISSIALIALTLYFIFQQLTVQLNLDKTRLDLAINTMSQGLLMFDQNERLIVCNRRYIDMYRLSPDAIRPGVSLRDVVLHRHATGSLTADVDRYCARVLKRRHLSERFLTETADGRLIEIGNEPVADGGWLVTHEDVTERVRAEARIAHLAHYDSLTNLPNRITMRAHLEKRLSELVSGEAFGVLYIDLDGFKTVNDTLGHEAGDQLLRQVAERLSGCIEPDDMVARLGGDEFAVMSTSASKANLTALADRILAALRLPLYYGDQKISTDASIGIAIAPTDGKNVEELLRAADLAMYAAKGDGRRTFRFFVADLDTKARLRQQIEMDLRHALTNGEFELHYQPLVDLKSGIVTGCEALLRWRHPKRGLISPDDFIPIAEHSGMIIEIGEWVLRTACREAATWPAQVRIALNISPVQFSSKVLALNVVAALAESGLSPDRLELEITETVLIGDDEQALLVLAQLRELGVRIALDDFGTVYSSLSYLHRFPFDKIKIDRSFIKSIGESDDTLPIVKAVVDIASARRMITTAEGVETQEQHDALRALGCNQMQGYLFSPAVPASKLRPLLRMSEDSVRTIA